MDAHAGDLMMRARLLAISEIGVTPEMMPSEAKHVRFCNVAAGLIFLAALLFAVAEGPLIVDWVGMREWVILFARYAACLPFALPLRLNARKRYRAARVVFIGWSILMCVGLTALYGPNAPSHVLFLSVVVAAVALFPRAERQLMWMSVASAAVALAVCLWLRYIDRPLVPVNRPIARIATEIAVTFGAFVIAVAVGLTQRATTARAEKRVLEEQAKAERLLLNILPAPIADRLKTSEKSIADAFDDVTVMFADLVGFTPLASELPPREVAGLMDRVFSEFDRVADSHGLEKIKTIGDAYMVAGGLPEPREGHTEAVAEMALELLPIIAAIPSPTDEPLGLRIGVARGAVVAGVIGRKKFSYDLWGDTVNTASRLESHGVPGRIHVNEAVRDHLGDRYDFESRGVIELKGKGRMETWFLTARKPS